MQIVLCQIIVQDGCICLSQVLCAMKMIQFMSSRHGVIYLFLKKISLKKFVLLQDIILAIPLAGKIWNCWMRPWSNTAALLCFALRRLYVCIASQSRFEGMFHIKFWSTILCKCKCPTFYWTALEISHTYIHYVFFIKEFQNIWEGWTAWSNLIIHLGYVRWLNTIWSIFGELVHGKGDLY